MTRLGVLATLAGITILAAALVAPAVAEVVRGTPEADRLVGGKKSDTAEGSRRRRSPRRQGRNDEMLGGDGGDKLIGGAGYRPDAR